MFFLFSVIGCQWSSYGKWSVCSDPCVGGDRTSKRTISQPAINGGKDCTVALHLIRALSLINNAEATADPAVETDTIEIILSETKGLL